MSDFLDSLVARGLGSERTILPRIPSRFEPAVATFDAPSQHESLEVIEDSPAREEAPAEHAMRTWPEPISNRNDVASEASISSLGAPRQTVDSPTNAVFGNALSRLHHVPATAQADGRQLPPTAHESSPTDRDMAGLHRQIDGLVNELELLRLGMAWRGSPAKQEQFLKESNAASDENASISRTNPDGNSIAFDHPSIPTQPSSTLPGNASHSPTPVISLTAPNHRATNETPLPPILQAAPKSVPPRIVPEQPPVASRGVAHAPARIDSLAAPSPRSTNRTPLPPILPIAPKAIPPRIVPEQLAGTARGATPPSPTVNVTIGRVEVKAVREAPSQPVKREKDPHSSSVMSLEQYLKRRTRGAE